jgi:mono/diheme cytochrome c family protein
LEAHAGIGENRPVSERRHLRRWLAGGTIAVASLAGALAWTLRGHVLPEHAPMERGLRAARALGCWDCHRDAARGGRLADAGAPSLLAGRPDPDALVRSLRAAPHDPALDARQVADLAAWLAVARLEAERADGRAAAAHAVGAAERLARRNCFGCHGELGQGGVANPGSLKGYVPGFFGRDYDLLTHDGDPAVVRQWIVDGEPAFFRSGLHPGPWLTARQQVRMPAYRGLLRPGEVDALVRYLTLLRALGPLDAEGVARYRARRALP